MRALPGVRHRRLTHDADAGPSNPEGLKRVATKNPKGHEEGIYFLPSCFLVCFVDCISVSQERKLIFNKPFSLPTDTLLRKARKEDRDANVPLPLK